MGLWGKAKSTEGEEQHKSARPHLYLVPKERRSGSLRDALRAAGHDPGPEPVKPVVPPEVIAAQLEGKEARELAQRYAPDRTEPALPAYWKTSRRERRRGRLRDAMAWIATVFVIGSIIAGAAIVLIGPAAAGRKALRGSAIGAAALQRGRDNRRCGRLGALCTRANQLSRYRAATGQSSIADVSCRR